MHRLGVADAGAVVFVRKGVDVPAGTTTWGGVASVALASAVVVVAADLAFSAVVPPPVPPDVDDGIAELSRGEASVLVLGSSHLRSFVPIADAMARLDGGQRRLALVPVDWGKASSYRWTWEHRIRPVLDGTGDPDGASRPPIRRIVLVTQWWDFRNLGPDDDPLINLPARAWTLSDFLADLCEEGLSAYNRNYLQNRWRRAFRGSPLVQYRGRSTLLDRLRSIVDPEGAERTRLELHDRRLSHFRAYVERGADRLFDPSDVEALDAMIDEWGARGLDVTVVLYPRMHGMITDAARASTLGRFSTFMADRCRGKGVRLVDLSWEHPLTDADFGDDLDHPTDEANLRFASWALDGPLRFLVEAQPGREGR